MLPEAFLFPLFSAQVVGTTEPAAVVEAWCFVPTLMIVICVSLEKSFDLTEPPFLKAVR